MLIKRNLVLIGLVVIIIIIVSGWGIWQYQRYQTDKKMRYCEKSSDCKWIESYGCVNLNFYYTQSKLGIPWTLLCACDKKKHRCHEVSMPQ